MLVTKSHSSLATRECQPIRSVQPIRSRASIAPSSVSSGNVANPHLEARVCRRSLMVTAVGAATGLPVLSASATEASSDLLVVGPGVLGGYAGHLWLGAHPGTTVVGLTNSTNNHSRLTHLGLQPMVKGVLEADRKFPFVLFSAPPSGAADYAGEVKAALAHWDSAAPGATFVFTSSMGVCSVDDGGLVREDCPLMAPGASPSSDRMLAAEQATLQAGGCVVRLVGLYHAQRGAHTYFLRIKEVPRPGDYTVNLIHYEDAARLAVSVLAGEGTGPFRERVFLGCDNHPIKFRDMIEACYKSPQFAGQGPVTWLQPDGGASQGKRADNSATRDALGGWAPKYDSFSAFMAEHGGRDWYSD
ncbi:hypothetical protein V8C86DRAFT_2613010, partial [Haematococcus lacustris]